MEAITIIAAALTCFFFSIPGLFAIDQDKTKMTNHN